jgi:hypothetical protein
LDPLFQAASSQSRKIQSLLRYKFLLPGKKHKAVQKGNRKDFQAKTRGDVFGSRIKTIKTTLKAGNFAYFQLAMAIA